MSNTYWSEQSFLRPLFIDDESWTKILSNFLSPVGDPVNDLPLALQDDLDRLEAMGFASPTSLMALRFALDQAGDFGSIAERGQVGSMGQGWSSLADVGLQISGSGMAITGLVDPGLIAALDATRTAQYTVSVPLGKTIGQDGRFAEGGNFTRPVFTLDQRQNSGMTLEYITGGYKVTTNAGEQYLFDATGKLESFITSTGEQITVIYDVNGRLSRYESATGDYLEFTYDVNGRVASVEDGNGRVVSYTYDVNGLLTDRVIANDNHPERSPARGEKRAA